MYILFILITFLSKMSARVVEIETKAIDEDMEIVSPITIQVTVLTMDPAIPHVVWSLIDLRGNVVSNIKSLTGRIRPGQYEMFHSSARLDFPNTPELVGRSVRVRISAYYDRQKGVTVYSKGSLTFQAPWTLSIDRFAIMGEEMKTTCIYTNNPIFVATEVLLTNSTQIKLTTNTKTCQMISTTYNVMVNCSETSFTLTFSATTLEFNQSYWRCFDDLDKTKSSRFEMLEIAVLPSEVTLLPGNVSGLSGDTVSMTCVSDRQGYPEPSYRWYIGNEETSDSTPNITLVLQENIHGLRIYCSLKIIQNRTTVSDEVPIYVYFLPSMNLVMEGIQDRLYIENGKIINVTCWIPAANPLPQIALLCSDGSNGAMTSNSTMVSTFLQLRQDRMLNGVECVCDVTQAITMYSDVEHRFINVIFAPSMVVSSVTASNWDNNIRIDCNVSANPAVTQLRWEHRVGDVVVRNQTTLQDFIHELYPFSLLFTELSYQDDGDYYCVASNGVLSVNNSLIVEESGKLTVKVEPVYTDLPMEFEGIIGNSLNIRFSFYSCPNVSSGGITIHKEDNIFSKRRGHFVLEDAEVRLVFHGKKVQLNGQTLIWVTEKLNRTFEGKYIVRIENKDGRQASSYFIIKAREETANKISNNKVRDILLGWISPILLCLFVVGGAIFIVKRRMKHSESQEIRSGAVNVSGVNSISERERNLNENGEESVYCLVSHLPVNEGTDNTNDGAQQVTLLAESSFLSQSYESASTSPGDGVTQHLDDERGKYETLKKDERCAEDDYSVIRS